MKITPSLFHLPPCLSPLLRKALEKPQSVQIIAQALLVREASPALRGDGMTAGPSIILDSIPAFSALAFDHRYRRPFQKLAGLIDDEGLRGLRGAVIDGIEVPSVSRVLEVALQLKPAFVRRLRAGADLVDGFNCGR